MNIWIIADTHFYHENIKLYQGRPDDFNEQLIRNWNKVVAYGDIVIHLGDVIFGFNKDNAMPSLLATLPGRKILCRGNHDAKSNVWYMEHGFDFACDYFVYKDIAFSHAPLTPLPPQALVSDGRLVEWNIHGHFHGSHHRDATEPVIHTDKYYDSKYYQAHKDHYVLVQIEDTLSPVPLDEILKVKDKDSGNG